MSKFSWLALLGVVLVLPRAEAGKTVVKKVRPAPQPAPVAKYLCPIEVVEGVGKTRQLALDQAALRAREKVEEQLNKHVGEGRWKHRPHQLEPDYLQEMGVISLDAASLDVPADKGLVVARYKVALTKKYEDAIKKHVVKGFGKAEQAAREQALVHAQEEVERLVLDLYRQDGWRPPARLLDPDRLKELGVIVPDGEPKLSREINDGKTWAAYYRVELTQAYRDAIQVAVRTELMQDRHPVLLRVLGGLVVLLLVTTGYLRLEEMTRGYATALLRALAAAIVLLAGLGLFLTC